MKIILHEFFFSCPLFTQHALTLTKSSLHAIEQPTDVLPRWVCLPYGSLGYEACSLLRLNQGSRSVWHATDSCLSRFQPARQHQGKAVARPSNANKSISRTGVDFSRNALDRK